jgi:hypothetical protein
VNQTKQKKQRKVSVLAVASVLTLPACQFIWGDFSQEEDSVSAGGGSSSTGGGTATGCPSNADYYCDRNYLVNCKTKERIDCGSDALCNWDRSSCLKCSPGEFKCEDNVISWCSDDRMSWTKRTDCSQTPLTPVCEAGVDHCVECVRDSSKCEGSSAWSCKSDRTWLKTPCEIGNIVSNCIEATDTEKAYCHNCDEGSFETNCSNDVTLITCDYDHIVSQICPGSTHCIPASATTPAQCL